MSDMLTAIRTASREAAARIGQRLDRWSHGRLTPDMVTVFGLAMHLPIAWLIASGHFVWAAGGLLVFGLFDLLDGGLARAQGSGSVRGMLLDASTDRFKEVLLYTGAAYWLATGDHPAAATWAAAASGAAVCVSYVKAKGEAAVASGDKRIPHAVLNRMFGDGLLTFELRMAVLWLGLVSGQLLWAVAVIAVLAAITSVQRLVLIGARL